jgi:D-alanyl-D-alanine carboxypeptidase/D-alanyl-D-alanine-endopeptidase (penicillin-binding protein 4)
LSLFFAAGLLVVEAQKSPAPVPVALPAPATLGDLQQRLAAHIAEPRFAAAMWGVKIVSLDSGRTVFEHEAHKLFSPASNSKLYTVAMALDRLGADYRIKTSLYSKSRPDANGVLKGDLIVYGRGDPTITARLHGDDIFAALEPLVAALTNAGVNHINGTLIGDESYFHGPPLGSGWAWDDLEAYYGAEISALTINDNTLQVTVKPGGKTGEPCQVALSPSTTYLLLSNRTETVEKARKRNLNLYRPLAQNVVYVSGEMPLEDSTYKDDVTMHEPAGLFVSFFREALDRHGISVGKSKVSNWLDRQTEPIDCSKMVELGSVMSLPMSDMVREVMKPSQNLYTDLLLAHVGEQMRTAETSANLSSESLGLRGLYQFLSVAGIKREDVQFEEGSGLSRNNLTTPNATIALLQHMSRHAGGTVYSNALPIAGVDGTLRNRMKGTPAAGNVRAKTGTLRWANALSGYVTTAAGEHLIFSVMLNRYHNPDPNRSARSEVDAIPVLLASFTGRTSTIGNR